MSTKLLTTEETADLIHVVPGTLMVWRSTGRYNLRYTKMGRKVFYDEKDVLQFIEERKRIQTA